MTRLQDFFCPANLDHVNRSGRSRNLGNFHARVSRTQKFEELVEGNFFQPEPNLRHIRAQVGISNDHGLEVWDDILEVIDDVIQFHVLKA